MPLRTNDTFLVVGAGFSGAVVARELADKLKCRVVVCDERSHIAGNCHTRRDARTNVMIHEYGPHIFNTDSIEVWKYVHRFGTLRPFTNRVKAVTDRGVFSLPINLMTINQFFKKNFSPDEAREFIGTLGITGLGEPQNLEEQALRLIGKDLYENFILGYTTKQWGVHPTQLPASILKRLPIRFNYDDNYYNTTMQGIPEDGYTAIVQRILDHPNIEVRLDTRCGPADREGYDHIFFTGPIDSFFGFSHGRLGYRTVEFERIDAEGDYQGNAVINYTSASVPYTRVHEHKHFAPWESHSKTVVFREYSKETKPTDVPFYPTRLAGDRALLRRYMDDAKETKGVSFIGRLATYRYLDMDDVIDEALSFASSWISAQCQGGELPVFSGDPLQ